MDGSTAAGDDSVAASEKSSDVGGERPDETAVQVPLRKTLSCSAKGILGSKLIESASGPVLPPGSPLSPGSPQCHQYPPMATSASQMLPRESTGPLLWRRTAFPAPVATPQQCPRGGLVVPVVRRSRESSPPCQVMAAPPSWPSSQRPVHVAAAWSQQHSVVRLVHPAQHQVPHAAPELRTKPSVLVQYAIQPQAVAVAPFRFAQSTVPSAGPVECAEPADSANAVSAVPHPLKDPAQIQAEEQIAKEAAASERREKARCDICEAVVEAAQLDITTTDLATLRQARTKLLNALASAQEVDLPRVERTVAEQQRRRLHNALQDMKGQLRVSCRIRPLSEEEKAQKGELGEPALRPLDSSRVELLSREGPAQVFEFDSVFRPDVPQQVVEEIFEDCRDLVQSAADGHNVTVMTYGQTGAGKTYTLFGNKDQEGLVQYMIREVFARLADSEEDKECSVSVAGSALELYNNHFIDLLRPVDRTGRQSPGVKVCVDAQGFVEVDGLVQDVAQTGDDLLEILQKGLAQRVVAEHALNADSSRSHMIFTVRLQTEGGSKKTSTRKLTFCDLGGCERIKRTQVAGELQKEAIEINKSLSALSGVIEAVAGRRRHVPYRDHKLTRLLQDAVGGSAKVLMYVCCSPARSNIDETAAALKLASRAAKVVNQPKHAEIAEASSSL